MAGALFNDLIETLCAGYIPQPGTEKAVKSELEGKNPCLILTGEPGSGKSALAAQLIREGGFLHYFLRKGHVSFGLWRDPYAFLTTIGFQLRDRFGPGIFPDAVGIDVAGNIRRIGKDGVATGVEILSIKKMPWADSNFNIRIEAEDIHGTAVAVRIREVIEDYRQIPLRTFRQMALIEPLRTIAARFPGKETVLWIDGLDEELDLLSAQGKLGKEQSITALLPLPEELAAIGNLRLVVTSRPGGHLDRFLSNGAVVLPMETVAYGDERDACMRAYLDEKFREGGLRRQIEAMMSVGELTDQVVRKAEGNFLYAAHFARSIEEGKLALLLEGSLPDGLEEIYVRVLDDLPSHYPGEEWEQLYAVLKVLAVTFQGLPASGLAQFTGLPEIRIKLLLQRLRQFLDTTTQGTVDAYYLYHASFRDCLTNPRRADHLWHIAAAEAHGWVGAYYFQGDRLRTEKIDDYGISYLPDHLLAAGDKGRRRLILLPDAAWRALLREKTHSNQRYKETVHKALQCTLGLDFQTAAVKVVGLQVKLALALSAEHSLPVDAFEIMALLRQEQRALDYIAYRPEAYPPLIGGLFQLDPPPVELILSLLHDALAKIDPADGNAMRLIADLLKACRSVNSQAFVNMLVKAADLYHRCAHADWNTPDVSREIARLLYPLNPDNAREWFLLTVENMVAYTRSSLNYQFRYLCETWGADHPEEVMTAVEQIQFYPNEQFARGLILLAKAAYDHQNEAVYADLAYAQIPGVINLINDPYAKTIALIETGMFFYLHQETDNALACYAQAVAGITAIGDPARDSDHTLQGRRSYLAGAAIKLAELAWYLEQDDYERRLGEAWELTQKEGIWNAADVVPVLIALQMETEPDYLEAFIEAVPNFELKAQLEFDYIKRILPEDPLSARRKLEKLLIRNDARGVTPQFSSLFGVLAGDQGVNMDEPTEAAPILSTLEELQAYIVDHRRLIDEMRTEQSFRFVVPHPGISPYQWAGMWKEEIDLASAVHLFLVAHPETLRAFDWNGLDPAVAALALLRSVEALPGQLEKFRCADLALSRAESVPDPMIRTCVLCAVARAMARVGLKKKAQAIVETALPLIETRQNVHQGASLPVVSAAGGYPMLLEAAMLSYEEEKERLKVLFALHRLGLGALENISACLAKIVDKAHYPELATEMEQARRLYVSGGW